MKLAEATQLIQQALTPVDKDWYYIDVVFNKEVERVNIHKNHVTNIIQDILVGQGGYPRCTIYATSVRRLMNEEKCLNKDKYKSLDMERYETIKWEILDLDIPTNPSTFKELQGLGMNPTGAIDYDNKTKFHLNNLLRKQWRSKRDSDAGKTKQDIIIDIHESLRSNPKAAFVNNRYLPSIIEYYRDRE